jgi:hypothetical protein
VLEPQGDGEEPFAKFCAAYPKRVGEDAARVQFDKAVKRGADPNAIIAAAKACAISERQRIEDDGTARFTMHPKNWLRDGRYKDAPEGKPILRTATSSRSNGLANAREARSGI